MKKTISLCLMVIAFSGCASTSKTYTANGEEGYNITCSGGSMTWGACYKKAGNVCGPKGYVVLEGFGDNGPVLLGNDLRLYEDATKHRSMIIKCKE